MRDIAVVEAFRRVRARAPDEFRALAEALHTHAIDVTVAVIHAAPENILNSQGRAQHSRVVVEMIEESMTEPKQPAPDAARAR